jgi:hypothetical protein
VAVIGQIFGVGGVFLIVVLAMLAIPIWAFADAVSRPSAAFAAAGSSKGLWITLIVVLWFLTGIVGLILSIVYLASIRPRVRAVMS